MRTNESNEWKRGHNNVLEDKQQIKHPKFSRDLTAKTEEQLDEFIEGARYLGGGPPKLSFICACICAHSFPTIVKEENLGLA